MKKIALFALLAAFGMTANAQTKSKTTKTVKKTISTTKGAAVTEAKAVAVAAVGGPAMEFESETIDYGTIAHNADGKREFVLKNTGDKPLIISGAQGSCGCTVPTYPKDPIAPGEKAVIGVKYATDRVGAFQKTVTLTTNATVPTKVLTIKGTVQPDADAMPAAPSKITEVKM